MSGTVTSIVMLDDNGNDVFAHEPSFGASERQPGELSYLALEHVREQYGKLSGGEYFLPLVYGLQARTRLRCLGLDAAKFAHDTKRPVLTYYSTWYTAPFSENQIAVDPYEICVPSESRNDIPVDGLCEFFGIEYPENLATNPRRQAEIAKELCEQAGITGFA